jgi:fanconi anemia group J protein
MDAWQSELETLFASRLIAPHVIDTRTQLIVRGIASGNATGQIVPLNSSFRSATLLYLDALADTLESICRVVPHGVLCFFPSYSLMDRCIERWKATQRWKQVEAVKPLIVIEPRSGI